MSNTTRGTNPSAEESQNLTRYFHRLNRVVPEGQDILKLTPETRVGDAIQQLLHHHYSQAPVVEGRTVLGVFSLRSFASKLIWLAGKPVDTSKRPVLERPVEDFLEELRFAHINDEFARVFEFLDIDDTVLIGEPDRVQAVVTPMDVLRYLYKVASPFMFVAEIEQSLRAYIRSVVRDEGLEKYIENCNKDNPKHRTPTALEKMTFGDYVALIGNPDNWPTFAPAFKGPRELTVAKLDEIRNLRNDIFHFKRELTVHEYQTLVDHRNWILRKVRIAEAKQQGE